MRSYEAARNLFSFLGFLAWCVICIGIIVEFVSIDAASGRFGGSSTSAVLAASLPGTILALFGLLALALVQNGRAAVDTAEYTQQMLQIARDQLEVSRQGLRGGTKEETGFAALNKQAGEGSAAPPISAPQASYDTAASEENQIEHQPGEVIDCRGTNIRALKAGYQTDGTDFGTLDAAKVHIDDLEFEREHQAKIQQHLPPAQ